MRSGGSNDGTVPGAEQAESAAQAKLTRKSLVQLIITSPLQRKYKIGNLRDLIPSVSSVELTVHRARYLLLTPSSPIPEPPPKLAASNP